ncbi:hypothetical protein QBC34DRAFT_377115 [Podospora aff. communis PSN243]|uniref:2EXR domain-containing protein n=1 Tax=Podospora aff. communis PSN243 TaxID=3040156 RepID=A0AAV9GUL1_9PEZI|nr:hypothetical protein QBC34DRAFT_377115 [Podospora aff. communis PSN243]
MSSMQPLPNTSSSPRFSSLPPELRLMIWAATLPPDIGPIVACWRSGCWQRRKGIPDKNEPHQGRELYRFTSTEVSDLVVYLPTLLVNHEARQIALRWARTNHITLSLAPAGSVGKCHARRKADLHRDAVFVPTREVDMWNRYLNHAVALFQNLLQPDAFHAATDHTLRHLVIAEEVLYRNWGPMYTLDGVLKISLLRPHSPLANDKVSREQEDYCRHPTQQWCELDEKESELVATYTASGGWVFMQVDDEEARRFKRMTRKAFALIGGRRRRGVSAAVSVYRGARLRIQSL